ncbi:FliH/SctL family protein [Pseudomonas uvaldensis]|uniref:FliH/SctL family protein n=1 Tax=Pseudomonas uvaldensis TaxID=2878385 RepID=UPI001E53DA10|nr:FliH/SctL family protein [Pseudomonas uvaldensis]MCE0460993.1 flagellar assembly protein FliH [Pseudomonas uvaldensis]
MSSSPKSPTSSTVLRQPSRNQGARRLPGLDANVGTKSLPDEGHSTDIKATLREAFALEFAEIERESRDKGLAQGLSEGSKQAREQLAEALSEQEQQWQKKEATLRTALETDRLQLTRLLEALESQHQQLMPAMEPLVGRIALTVVTRMLGQHVDTRSLVLDLARQAIEEYQLTGPLRIRVARADYETLLRLASDDPLSASFQIDPQAVVGSCLIDFEGGQLDVGVQTQLTNVSLVLTGQGDSRVAEA